MINREVRDRALNILENGTQAQYQNEAVEEYLEAKTIAIDSIKKLEQIENIVTETENQHYELQGKKVVMSSLAYNKIKGVIENG